MYSVRGDGIVIYQDVSPTESRKAVEPKLTLKDNAAGTLEISLPPGNAGYDVLKHMTSEIIVNKDGEDIWHGRIITENMDFWNNRKFTCEGELAYLNDTTQPPHKYADGMPVFDFVDAVLNEHNKRYGNNEERYKFYADASRMYNAEETLPEIVTDYETTLDCIIQNVVGKFECHLLIERVDGKKYLKFVKDETKFSENTQVIRFGDNLLDFTRNWDLTDLATVVIPRGKQLETKADEDSDELDKYVGLGEIPLTNVQAKSEFGEYLRDEDGKLKHDEESNLVYEYYDLTDDDGNPIWQYEVVTENGTHYIYLDEDKSVRVNVDESSADKKIVEFLEDGKVTSKIETDDTYCVVYLKDENGDFYSLKDTYGHVEQVVDFSDAEDSIELLKKTRDYIKEHRFDGMTLEVSAVDLHYLSDNTEPVKMLDRMRCISYPHGMNTLFTVTELSIQLDKPDSAKYTLEKTMRIGARQTAISDSMSAVEAEVESAHSTILTRAKQTADKILREKTNGYVNLVTDTDGGRHSQALVISSGRDWQTSEHFWVWNVNGLGHYTEYGGNTKPAKDNDDPDGEMFKGYELNVGITMNGAIVANRITVGHMSADRVRTGVLMSQDGNVVWNLNNEKTVVSIPKGVDDEGNTLYETYTADPGSLMIKSGSITLGVDETHPNGHFSVDNNGYLMSEYGKIGGFDITASNIHNDKMTLDGNGVHYYVTSSSSIRSEVGYIGSSYWKNADNKKLISMNLKGGDAISWGYADGETDADYTVKLMYVANGGFRNNNNTFTFQDDTLYVSCDMNLMNHTLYNSKIDPSSVGVVGGLTSEQTFQILRGIDVNNDGTINSISLQNIKLKNGFIVSA